MTTVRHRDAAVITDNDRLQRRCNFLARWLFQFRRLARRYRDELAAVDASLGEFYCPVADGGGSFFADHGVHIAINQLRQAEAEVNRLRAELRQVEQQLVEAQCTVATLERMRRMARF